MLPDKFKPGRGDKWPAAQFSFFVKVRAGVFSCYASSLEEYASLRDLSGSRCGTILITVRGLFRSVGWSSERWDSLLRYNSIYNLFFPTVPRKNMD